MKTFILKWRQLISSYKMEQFEEDMHYLEYGEFNWSLHEWEKARSGASNVGARDFLIAVNFNLNTTSTRRANAVAFDVREKGRPKREGNPLTGKIVKDADGNPVMIPGTLKGCKAIGWYIDEYGIAQVSMNITDINVSTSVAPDLGWAP